MKKEKPAYAQRQELVGAEHATLMMYKVQAGKGFGENIFYHDPKKRGVEKLWQHLTGNQKHLM